MKLRYKITLVITLISLVSIIAIALFYANFLLKQREEYARDKLSFDSSDLAYHIEQNLLDNLNMVRIMESPYIVCESLEKSNAYYESLPKGSITKKISWLNKRWMNTEDANDPFIKKYTNNKLAKYLKKQIATFPGVYGEIFITNRYGAVVASTGKLTTFKHDYKYWWKESYDYGHGKVFFDDRGFDESVGGYVLGIVVPIRKDGAIVGILKANINVHSLLSETIKKYNHKGFAKAEVVRTKGEVVYEEGLPSLSTKISPNVVKRLKVLKNGVDDMRIYDQNNIVAYSAIKLSSNNENITFGGKKRSVDHLLGNDGEIWHIIIMINKNRIFNFILQDLRRAINVAIFFILFIAVFIFVIIDKISRPLRSLSRAALKVGNGQRDIDIDVETDDEIGELASSFKQMLQNLKETTASRDELTEEIKKRIEAQKELKRKDEILIAQSKQAAMGEMISMIAHQWRQPISVISLAVNNIMVDMELDELNESNVRECSSEVLNETQYLSQTIDDFRNFFKPGKEKETIQIQKLFDDVYKLVGKSFENNNIELSFLGDSNTKIQVYSKEFLQVFINILNNAKDALIESSAKTKKISIFACKKEESIVFEFCDNATGIKEENMGKIFEPYFSTKDEKNGTGLGLYMSKTIVEKHLLGKIWAENRDEGACFVIELPTNLGKSDE